MTRKPHKFNIVLATHNEGKTLELQSALADLNWTIKSLNDFELPSPDETGTSFEANSFIKAKATAESTQLWSLADDSGLEVDALNGLPGVDTAHYGGWERLLTALDGVDIDGRTARFICVLTLYRMNDDPLVFRGICEGTISLEARGANGFGYDPVFIPNGDSRTFAEMNNAEKYQFSHRGMAVEALKKWALNLPSDSLG